MGELMNHPTLFSRLKIKKLGLRMPEWKTLGLALLMVSISAVTVDAQHYLTKGSDPPGMIAQKRIMQNPNLAGFVQPVQIYTPPGTLVSTWSSRGFGVGHDSVMTAGFTIGQVYRLRVENIPRFAGNDIYPSVEVIDRLHPPEGMENQFPIQVVITQDDLEKAIAGRLVTKIVYLEDSDKSLPYRPIRDDQPYFDIGPTEDPLRTAESLGRPMAIVRIGSRTPSFDDYTSGEFDFFSNPVFALQNPQPSNKGFERIDQIQISELVPEEPVKSEPDRNVPPIISGNKYRENFRR